MSKGYSPIADDLAEASWTAADVALATAWRDMRRMIALIEEAKPRKGSRLQAVSDEAELVKQSLERAVRLRGLAKIGSIGGVERFDAARHEALDDARPRSGVLVSIVAPGLARLVGEREDILACALVRRLHPPKAQSGKAAKPKTTGAARSRQQAAPTLSGAAVSFNLHERVAP